MIAAKTAVRLTIQLLVYIYLCVCLCVCAVFRHTIHFYVGICLQNLYDKTL